MNNSQHLQEQINHPAEKPKLIGKLSCRHIIFLLIAAFMVYMTVYTRSWMAAIGILLFCAGEVFLTVKYNKNRHQRLNEIWSELALLTGLDLNRGRFYLIGTPEPPSLTGNYRRRHITITKVIVNVGDYESSVSAVHTRIMMDIANTHAYHLDVRSAPFLLRLSGRVASGDRYFDRHFDCGGTPADFVQKAVGWISIRPALYKRPEGVIMLADGILSFTNWEPPTFHLEGAQLTYDQSGVVSNIPEQVNIINILCDLAEFIEESEHEPL